MRKEACSSQLSTDFNNSENEKLKKGEKGEPNEMHLKASTMTLSGTTTNRKSILVRIPHEILLALIQWLDVYSLERIGRTCRHFRRFTLSDTFWMPRCLNIWPNDSSLSSEFESWRRSDESDAIAVSTLKCAERQLNAAFKNPSTNDTDKNREFLGNNNCISGTYRDNNFGVLNFLYDSPNQTSPQNQIVDYTGTPDEPLRQNGGYYRQYVYHDRDGIDRQNNNDLLLTDTCSCVSAGSTSPPSNNGFLWGTTGLRSPMSQTSKKTQKIANSMAVGSFTFDPATCQVIVNFNSRASVCGTRAVPSTYRFTLGLSHTKRGKSKYLWNSKLDWIDFTIQDPEVDEFAVNLAAGHFKSFIFSRIRACNYLL